LPDDLLFNELSIGNTVNCPKVKIAPKNNLKSISMTLPINAHLFDHATDPAAFRAYREIKYRVFVEELGWADLADARNPGLIKVDAYDPISSFALLSTASGEPFAIVRATPLSRGFPYRELFERHLAQPAFADHLDRLCSINALAVLPDYRRRVFRESAHGWQGSAGQLLLLGILGHMARAGLAGQRRAVAAAGHPRAHGAGRSGGGHPHHRLSGCLAALPARGILDHRSTGRERPDS
jgi:hypothetical protein